MPTHLVTYIFNRGVDSSKTNLLKNGPGTAKAEFNNFFYTIVNATAFREFLRQPRIDTIQYREV